MKRASSTESLSHWQMKRPSIAARSTGTSSTIGFVEITMPPTCWLRWRGKPEICSDSSMRSRQIGASTLAGVLGVRRHLRGDVGAAAPAGALRQPVQLALGDAERLADVADGAAQLVRGEAGDERGVLAAELLVHAQDELLADVAREVEVDVRDGGDLVAEEAAEEEVVLDRVDVREADQVAEDRADGGAAAAAGRQAGLAARAVLAAHLVGDLAAQLEQVAVDEEEAGEAVLAHEPQLLLQPLLRRRPGCGRR